MHSIHRRTRFTKVVTAHSARRIRERLVEITRQAYGLAHPATGHSIKNLVALLQEMGDHRTAGKLIEEFLAGARAAGIALPPSNRHRQSSGHCNARLVWSDPVSQSAIRNQPRNGSV